MPPQFETAKKNCQQHQSFRSHSHNSGTIHNSRACDANKLFPISVVTIYSIHPCLKNQSALWVAKYFTFIVLLSVHKKPLSIMPVRVSFSVRHNFCPFCVNIVKVIHKNYLNVVYIIKL